MVYECEKCQSPLGAGMLFCPYCGEKFPSPVPSDAVSTTPSDVAQPALIGQAASEFPSTPFQPQTPMPPVRKKPLFGIVAFGAVAAFIILLIIIGSFNQASTTTVPPANTKATYSAMTSASVALTPEQKHIAAVKEHEQAAKAHQQVLQQERQARAQKKEEQREARRQAREQEEQAREEARAARAAQEAQRADEDAFATIKAKVQHDYPNDYITQKGVYDMAVEAYQFMKTVPDDEIKAKVVNDYPDDYITQKGVYEMAAKAKQDMQ